MMDIKEFLNIITVRRYINLHFDNAPCNREKIDLLIKTCKKKEPKWLIVDIDLDEFVGNEEGFLGWFLNKANEKLSWYQFPHLLQQQDNFNDLLKQLEEYLIGKQAILFLFPFAAIMELEKENTKSFPHFQRNIFKEIRKFIGMSESLQPMVAIISDIKVNEANLHPTSPLDERHMDIIEINELVI